MSLHSKARPLPLKRRREAHWVSLLDSSQQIQTLFGLPQHWWIDSGSPTASQSLLHKAISTSSFKDNISDARVYY